MDYLDTEQNKSAHFSFALPFQFAAQRRACLTARQGFLQSRVSAADADFTLSEQEVSILGEGGIRTLDAREGMPHFECGTFNHSATSPKNPLIIYVHSYSISVY